MENTKKNPGAETDKDVVLVTGGSGFIGSKIIERLSKQYRVVCLDKGGNSHVTSESVYMDMSDEESIMAAMARISYAYGKRIASVIHLAAYYDFAGKPSPLYDIITVQGTKKLLQALNKFHVGQFIFSSSLLVYKPTAPGHKITEESPVKPSWDYPNSKIKAEKAIHRERDHIPTVMLRIAGVYNDEGSSIPIANHIQRIYEKELTSHFFPGDMSHGNPFIHLDDLVEAIAAVVEKRQQLPAELIINIGEPETLSYEYLQKRIGKLLHRREWKTYRIPEFMAKAGAWVQDLFGDPFIKPWMIHMADDHMEIDISKAHKLLEWAPAHSLKDTLEKITASLKSNPGKWYAHNKLKAPSRLKKKNT